LLHSFFYLGFDVSQMPSLDLVSTSGRPVSAHLQRRGRGRGCRHALRGRGLA
jgi:hypothetical protein